MSPSTKRHLGMFTTEVSGLVLKGLFKAATVQYVQVINTIEHLKVYLLLLQLGGETAVVLLQFLQLLPLCLPALLQDADLRLQLLHPSEALFLCPGCTAV